MTDADHLLAARFAATYDATDDGDWSNVVRRAGTERHRQRRLVGLTAFVALAVVGGASAIVLGHPTVNFFTANKGPKTAFAQITKPHPSAPAMPRIKLTARARRIAAITLGGRQHVLLVAPTTGGGFCMSVSGPYGGTSCQGGNVLRRAGGVIDPGMTSDQSGPILFHGYFTTANATRLQVLYQDGSTDTIPFVWVGSPIRAGFFLFGLSAHRHEGHRPVTLTILGAGGKRLAEVHINS